MRLLLTIAISIIAARSFKSGPTTEVRLVVVTPNIPPPAAIPECHSSSDVGPYCLSRTWPSVNASAYRAR
jgi:hypothetical protein